MLLGARLANALPYDREVEWLAASCERTYIDTDISTSQGLVSIGGNMCVTGPLAKTCYCIGVWGANNTRFGINVLSGDRLEFRIGGYSPIAFANAGITIGDFFSFEVNGITKKAYINGNLKWTSSGSTVNTNNIGIFSALQGEKNPEGGASPCVRIKDVRIVGANGVLRDLIAVRKGDVGYMYDRANGRLYSAEGNGYLIIGPDKEST